MKGGSQEKRKCQTTSIQVPRHGKECIQARQTKGPTQVLQVPSKGTKVNETPRHVSRAELITSGFHQTLLLNHFHGFMRCTRETCKKTNCSRTHPCSLHTQPAVLRQRNMKNEVKQKVPSVHMCCTCETYIRKQACNVGGLSRRH